MPALCLMLSETYCAQNYTGKIGLGLQMILLLLDYCSPIWDPFQHNKSIYKIEMIQHWADQFVLDEPWNRHHWDSFSELLDNLKWSSVQTRSKQVRLISVLKMLNGLICIPNHVPSPFPVTIIRSHHPIKLQQLYIRTDIYDYSFYLKQSLPVI